MNLSAWIDPQRLFLIAGVLTFIAGIYSLVRDYAAHIARGPKRLTFTRKRKMRKVKINESPNPTGLSMRDRQVALDVLRSLEESTKRLGRQHVRTSGTPRSREQVALDFLNDYTRVLSAAKNQLQGRQAGTGDLFRLERDPDHADMDYVMQSLGVR